MSTNTKLTNAQRETILNRLLDKAFKERLDAFAAREHEIGNRMYQAMYGDHVKTMNKLPAGFLETSNVIRLREIPQDFRALLNDIDALKHATFNRNHFCRVQMDKARRVGLYNSLEWSDQPALCEEWAQFASDVYAVLLERDEFKRNATALLWSVKTRAALLSAWPEVKPLIPEIERTEHLPVPLELTIKLNAQLGIVGARA